MYLKDFKTKLIYFVTFENDLLVFKNIKQYINDSITVSLNTTNNKYNENYSCCAKVFNSSYKVSLKWDSSQRPSHFRSDGLPTELASRTQG